MEKKIHGSKKGELVVKNLFLQCQSNFGMIKMIKNLKKHIFLNTKISGTTVILFKEQKWWLYNIHGRSDATLNPGGVRLGTAEIYRQVENIDFIRESLVVGQNLDNDVKIILFVVIKF